ncbi:MAG: hypothetical protein QOK15_1428 [Nocardioidaceae bacterium]|nr:hypothetical protein [Nocardioidaceae bacterium]
MGPAIPLKEYPVHKGLVAVCIAVLVAVGVSAPAGADAPIHVKVNQQIPLSGLRVFVPCTRNTIRFTQGSLHDMFHATLNGSHFSLTSHSQPHNLKGTDRRGRSYEGVGITRESDSGSFVNGQAVTTFVNNFNMIGKAGAPSYRTHETFHVTVTASGHLTAFHDHLRVTCR